MTDEATKTQPTVAELEAKAQRLINQVAEDAKLEVSANDAFTKAVKSGNVDAALATADKRTAAKATLAKSEGQLKTARSAITSAKRAANAGRIADLSEKRRGTFQALPLEDGPVTIPCSGKPLAIIEAIAKMGSVLAEYAALGVDVLKIERSEESGNTIINPAGPSVKRTRASGGGGGGKGQPLTVDGQQFDSASAALLHFRPDFTGKMGRESIISWLNNNEHEVS